MGIEAGKLFGDFTAGKISHPAVFDGKQSNAFEMGVFSHENIEPADYVVVVGEVIGIHEIISNSDGSAKIYTAEEGQIIDVGIIRVSIE